MNRNRNQAVSAALRGLAGVAVLAAVVAAARPAPLPQSAPPSPPPHAAASAQTASPPASPANETQAALDAADAILQQMSAVTGLPVKSALHKQLISKPEMTKYLEDNLSAEMPPKEMHAEEASLKAFGVVDADFDLRKFMVSFFTEQAAGLYDPRRKTMFIADWVPPELESTVLAHELTHALQDQSFDLWKFMHAARDDDDATAARDALAEGYATLSMTQASLGNVPVEKVPSLEATMDQLVSQQMDEFPVFTHAPYFLRFQALFPYIQGMRFALRGLTLEGWKGLNRAFENPPSTTAQIFEPGLYFDPPHDAPPNAVAAVDLPPAPALERARRVHRVQSNTMGELGYYALLGQLVSPEEAEKLGGSWRGDRYLVYEGPGAGEYALVARTRWATPAAAGAFCADYRSILEKRWQGSAAGATAAAAAAGGPQVLLSTSGARRAFLLTEGDECRWAEDVPAPQAGALQAWMASLP